MQAGSLAAAALLVILAVAPLAGLVLLARTPDPLTVAVEAIPEVWFEPEQVTIDGMAAAQLAFSWAVGASVGAPDWSGLVTDVAVDPGDQVTTGARVLDIDGVPRIAAATSTPLWRPLGSGDTGADVAALNDFLATLDLPHGQERWTTGTRAGVRQFQRDYLRTAAGHEAETFDHTWLVWLPHNPSTVGSVAVIVGDRAPDVGAAIYEEPPRITAARLTDTDGNQFDMGSVPDWTFSSDRLPDPVAISAGNVAEPDLASLTAAVSPDTEGIVGNAAHALPTVVVSVPPAAVIQDDQSTCVLVRSQSQPVRVTPVDVSGGSLGATYLANTFGSDEQILANPGASGRGGTCES